MSLDSILNYIIGEANKKKDDIIREARQQADAVLREARQQADKLYQEIIDLEKFLLEKERQKIIVNSRLEGKKNSLKTRQEMIDAVFEKVKSGLKKGKFKRVKIYHDKTEEVDEDVDFYLNKIRHDYEAEITRILFS